MATLDAPSEIWVKTKKLKESGLEYKEGKYSAEEKQKLTAAIEAYKEEHNLTEDQLQVLIYKRRNSQISEDHKMFTSQHKDMWKDIVGASWTRPLNEPTPHSHHYLLRCSTHRPARYPTAA
jgi:hypothetical protein